MTKIVGQFNIHTFNHFEVGPVVIEQTQLLGRRLISEYRYLGSKLGHDWVLFIRFAIKEVCRTICSHRCTVSTLP